MEEKKIVLDTKDVGQQTAFALGNGYGYRQGAHDVIKGIVVSGLVITASSIAVVACESTIKRIKNKVENRKEKRRLKKEQKRKAKEERAE